MADLTLIDNGTPITVNLGESTELAGAQRAAAEAAAELAARYANNDDDADIEGGETGERGSRFWRDMAAAAAASAQAFADALADLAISGASPYETYAIANADLANIPADAWRMVLADETHGNERTFYRKESGSLVFKGYAIPRNLLKTWWVDPVSGSDSNAGTIGAPFATFAKAGQVSAEGDLICGKSRAGTVTVKETIDFSALNNRRFDAPGYVFMGYDTEVISWTYVSGNVWKATVSHDFGGNGVRDTAVANKVYTGLFGVTATTETNYRLAGNTPANEAAAVAALTAADMYIVLGPTVGGLQSSNPNGWAQGNHTYYVRTDGTDPNTLTWRVQQRGQPKFGTGWTIGNLNVFGGKDHNGVEMMGATITGTVEIWYASCHGSFICGAQCRGGGKLVYRYRNRNGSAGYAAHTYNGGARLRATLLNVLAHGFNEALDNCFGGHGSNQGNDITEIVEIEAELYDVNGIGACGEPTAGALYGPVTKGTLFRKLKAYGFQTTNFAVNTTVIECDLVHSGTTSAGPCFLTPQSGRTASIKRGSIASCPEGLFTNGTGTGTVNFGDLTTGEQVLILVGCERVNFRFWGATAGNWNFNRCLIESDGGSDAAGLLGKVNGSTVTLTDSAHAGVEWPSATTRSGTQRGGHIGLMRGPQGQVIANDNRRLDQALGERVIGATWPVANASLESTTQSGYVLTNRGFYKIGAANSALANPFWTAVTGYTITGVASGYKASVAVWVVAYGPNSTILRWNVNDAVGASPTVVDTSAVTGKTITSCSPSGTDGKLWFGCSDGAIIEVDLSNTGGSGGAPLAVARTSGVTYPLLDAERDAATIYFVGSDASGSTGTVGGAIRSTDTGANWSNVLASGDGSGAVAADWHKRVKCVRKVNGVVNIFGARGCWLASDTGDSGDWDIIGLGTDADMHTCAADTVKKRLLVGGAAGLGPDYRGVPLAVIDCTALTGAELTGSKTFDPTSLADGAGESTTITVTGAALGDYVEVSFSNSTQSMLLDGEVTSANTITARFQQETGGGPIDLASGTLAAIVRPKGSNPATFWKPQLRASPVSAIGPKVLCARGVTQSPNSLTQWVVTGQLRQVAIGEDPAGEMRRTHPPASVRSFTTDSGGRRSVLLAAA